jgi:NADP-dependent 3-hydroxy acid dehydrogenase YdfG
MARWMVTKGAHNLVLISRSGATGKVKELMDELTALGANVLVRSCDVADKKSVDSLLSNELGNMPPVRGVVHGAMVLRVSRSLSQPFLFSNMIRMSCSRK